MIDEDDVDEATISLCADCARHPRLKALVEESPASGVCGLCGRDDVPVYDPIEIERLAMLVRALIRFHWDEWSYNTHWGGDEIEHLLSEPDNPLLRPGSTVGLQDTFFFRLFDPPYPERDKGIAIYAGFDAQGMRHMVTAISRTDPAELRSLQRRLLTENFFDVEPDLEALIEPFIGDIPLSLPAGEIWYRARLGFAARYQHFDGSFTSQLRYQPWLGAQIGAPPPPIATPGRLNRAGVSVLYLGSDPKTAVAEIRPHPGHHVSIGGFRSLSELRLADFNPDIAKFATNDDRLDIFELIQAFDRLMATPVTPDERVQYLLTQLLAEILRRRGFDGVRFRSSVSAGNNICIFDPSNFAFEDAFSEVRRIAGLIYEIVPEPSTLSQGQYDLELA